MMKKTLYFGSVITIVLAFTLIYVSVANAQNVTTNASNALGNASANASASANQTAGNITNNTEGVGGLFGNLTEKLKEAIGTK
jgi:hypothetical protein